MFPCRAELPEQLHVEPKYLPTHIRVGIQVGTKYVGSGVFIKLWIGDRVTSDN